MQSFDGKPGWICNTCRFDKKKTTDWSIEGLTTISRHSVIGANKYSKLEMPGETVQKVMHGREPKRLMDIHSVSEVNKPGIHLSDLKGPAHSEDFKNKLTVNLYPVTRNRTNYVTYHRYGTDH